MKETKSLEQPKTSNRVRGALPMLSLCVPLVLEQFFKVLVSSADTVMLSSYSEKAVAGVGIMAQYVFFLNILFGVIATGASIVLSQYIGAQKSDYELNSISCASTVMICSVAIILMGVVFAGTRALLNCYNLEDEVRVAAFEYFIIFGGIGAIFNSLSLLQSAILRCYGYTKEALFITFTANVINVLGNAISLYGFFGLPIFGVKGVAWSSTISMIVSCALLAIVIKHKKDVCYNLRGVIKTQIKYYKMILSVGIPTASENLSYNVSQIVIMGMISTLGTVNMSANIYARTICQYVYIVAIGLGAACQIKAGYYVGAHQSELIYKKMFKYSFVASSISMCLILLINIFKKPLIGIFTNQTEIYTIVTKLLKIAFLLEFGRSLNLIWVGALKGAGDIKFPVLYGIFSNWCIMVLLGSVLGLKCGLGIFGFWLGISLDETTRGIVMIFRWKSRRWQTKSLV